MGNGSWSNDGSNLIILIEEIVGYSGLFGYSPAPGPGNLVLSITAAAGTDPYGNAYQAGVTVYGPDTSINMFGEDVTLTASNGSMAVLESGLNAGLYLTPSGGPWSAGSLLSGIGGGNHPTMTLSSPADETNGVHSSITLEGSSTGDARTIILSACTFWNHTGTFQINSSDIGSGIQSQNSITANVTGLTTTETVLMTIPSMTYVNGRAYRVHLWGLQQSTTAATYFLHQLRKGSATTSGTVYKGQMRVPVINAASTNGPVDLEFILVNTSGADITTAVTWTGSCAAGTGIFAASAGNVATATVEDVGLASQWPGQPIS